MLFEEHFDVTLPDDAAERLSPLRMTVRELATLLEQHGSEI
jgi:hypothetical protein